MSFSIVFQCPLHPQYQAKARPATTCRACRLMFDVRNNTNKALSTPLDERDELNELIIKEITQ